jgi:hypothetical protein
MTDSQRAPIKWNKCTFDWGNRIWSFGVFCMIEDNKKTGVKVHYEKGFPISEPRSFKSVRAAKKYVNSLTHP